MSMTQIDEHRSRRPIFAGCSDVSHLVAYRSSFTRKTESFIVLYFPFVPSLQKACEAGALQSGMITKARSSCKR